MTETKLTFVEKYPTDYETQVRLLDELDDYLVHLTPEKVIERRFIFLLEYFVLNGNEEMQKMATEYLRAIIG